MMTKRTLAPWLTLLAALWVVACIPTIKRPEVQLVGVRLGSLGLQGGLLYVQVGVDNPNSFALRADSFTYHIELREPGQQAESWSNLAEGTFNKAIQVPAHDSTVVEIPVEFRYSGIGTALRSILDTGTFNYRISGSVAVEKPVRTDIPYRHTGTASLARFD